LKGKKRACQRGGGGTPNKKRRTGPRGEENLGTWRRSLGEKQKGKRKGLEKNNPEGKERRVVLG